MAAIGGKSAIWLGALALLAACSSDDDDPNASREVAYACAEGVSVSVVFNPVSRIATVIGLGPRAILLPQREAGSGFLYATDRVALRGEGEAATLTVDGASVACRAVPNPS